jgi:hypothetical protein
MKLKTQLEELRSFNEKGQVEFQRVQMENEVLRKTIEEHQNQTVIVEVVKTKSLEKNEELWSMQKILFSALDKVLVIGYEWTKFKSQVKPT